LSASETSALSVTGAPTKPWSGAIEDTTGGLTPQDDDVIVTVLGGDLSPVLSVTTNWSW
jgi:hypothetical protein